MKILCIGDLHIKTNNFDEIDILINEIKKTLSQKTYDAVVLLGDILDHHEKIYTQCLNKCIHFIETIKNFTPNSMIYIIVGNHDMIHNQVFLSDQHWLNLLKSWGNVKVVDNVVEEELFLLVPYVFPGRFIEALETKTKNWSSKKLIFAHQEFKGCKMGAIQSIEGDEWLPSYPQVISGHIHDNQKIGNNIYYPGTPLQHAFGDSDVRVLCSIEIENDEIKLEDIPLQVPKKQIIKTDLTNIKETIRKIENKENQKIKIKLDVSSEEFKIFKDTKEYKQLIDSGVKIQLQKKKEKIEDLPQTGNFLEILESVIQSDEPLVRKLYEEVVLERLIL